MTSDFDPPPPASWYAPASDAPKGGTRVHVSWLIAALAAALCLGLGGLAVGYFIGDHHEQISAAIKGTQAPAAAPPCEAKSAPSVIYKTLLVMLLPAPVGSQKPTGVNAAQELSLNAYVQQLYSDPAYETPRLRARCFQAPSIAGGQLDLARSSRSISSNSAVRSTQGVMRSLPRPLT